MRHAHVGRLAGIATRSALCASAAAAIATATALAITACGLSGDARKTLQLEFAGVPRSASTAVEIAVHNTRLAAGALACAAVVPRLGRRTRRALTACLAALLALNATTFGVAIGAYGMRVLAVTRLHLPLELAGLSLAGGAYLQATCERLRHRALMLVAAICVSLLGAAAALETYVPTGASR